MAKAATLDIDLNAAVPHHSPTVTAPRSIKEKASDSTPKNDTAVNFRWPAAEVKALKRAALDADMTMQDYLLSCFHSYLQSGNIP